MTLVIGWLIYMLLVVANLLYFIIGLLNRWVAENIRNKVGRQGPGTRHPQPTKPYFPISIPTNTFPLRHFSLYLCCLHGNICQFLFLYFCQILYSSHFSHIRQNVAFISLQHRTLANHCLQRAMSYLTLSILLLYIKYINLVSLILSNPSLL